MGRPRMAYEVAAEHGMSVDDFVGSKLYAAGVKDGSVIGIPDHYAHEEPTGSYEATPGTSNESEPAKK